VDAVVNQSQSIPEMLSDHAQQAEIVAKSVEVDIESLNVL
jgi:hypothetical protein